MVALQRALLCCNGSDSAEMVEAARRRWRQSRGSSFAAMVVAVLGWLRSRCKGSGHSEMAMAVLMWLMWCFEGSGGAAERADLLQ
jgi:hypothetical protein